MMPDATAAVDWLLQTAAGKGIEKRIYSRNETLHAPHLLDLEVTQVLRRLALQGMVAVRRADEAVRDLLDLRITRYPHLVLLPRIWQLRHNLSAYDAAYISRSSSSSGCASDPRDHWCGLRPFCWIRDQRGDEFNRNANKSTGDSICPGFVKLNPGYLGLDASVLEQSRFDRQFVCRRKLQP